MGLVLDLAVVALAVAVTGSILLLAWTLGVSATRAIPRERARIAAQRARLSALEARLPRAGARAQEAIRGAGARIARLRQGDEGTE